jgi:hypothetical protein
MALWRPVRTFRQLQPTDRRLFVEAAMLSAMVWTGLRTLPFATLRRVLEKCWVRGSEATAVPTLRIVWAVHAASRRLPGGRTCLVEALAADVMLRRRGYAPVLHLGVRKRNDREELLDGHAWVVCDNRVVVGAVDELGDYTEIVADAQTTATP